MSASSPNAFEKRYSDDVTHLASQHPSRLLSRVRVIRGVNGSTYDFHTMAGLTAASRAAGSNAEVVGLDPTQGVKTATLTDWEVPVYSSQFDRRKQNIDELKEIQVETVAAINRKIDDIIIAALVATTGLTTTTTTAGGVTYAKLLEIVTYFNTNDVDPDDRTLVISPEALADALAITQLTNGDYMSIGAIMNAGIGSALGMKWIVSTRLPLATADRSVFAFDRRAVGFAMGMDVKTEINYIPQRVSTLINTMFSGGAVVVDPLHVVRMVVAE